MTIDADFDVNALVLELGERAVEELKAQVDFIAPGEFPDEDDLLLEARKWHRIEDVVAVSADLRGSTRLNFDKHAQTSARLYEAATGSMVRSVQAFDPEFVDIQGDGLFALFHGDRRYERAFCAAVTVKTFGEKGLQPAIETARPWIGDRFPSSGLKVGMASGWIVVKKVGVRDTNEPVWAGRPVNWATKAAQAARVAGEVEGTTSGELIVTESVFRRFEDNDYIRFSCGCKAAPKDLWSGIDVAALTEHEVPCWVMRTAWCDNCGTDFCRAILAGDTEREDVTG